MNKADSVFAKEDPQVEVPYVGPHLRCINDTSMIPKSRVNEIYII